MSSYRLNPNSWRTVQLFATNRLSDIGPYLHKFTHIKPIPMKPNALPNDLQDNEFAVSAPIAPSTCPLQIRTQVSNCFSSCEPIANNLEKITPCPDLVGSVYRVSGRGYGLTQEGMVYDLQSRQFVDDARIRDQVFDRYEESLRFAASIRSRARALAHGDPDMEEALKIHFAFVGMPQNEASVAEERVA